MIPQNNNPQDIPEDEQLDGCDVPISDFTADEDLPKAEGGVE